MLQPGEGIRYTPHALERMAEFGIAEEDVRATLEDPNRTRAALPRPLAPRSIIYLRRIGPRTCKVYVRAGSRPMHVLTAVWHGEGPQERGTQ